jgi:hypothetical protein
MPPVQTRRAKALAGFRTASPGLGMFLTAYPPFSASHALAFSVG